MDQEREQQRRTYWICRLGFGILSIALALASFSSIVMLLRLFLGWHAVGWIINTPFWKWLDAPIVWGSLLGTYLLWGRWSDTGWQRRSGLLIVMSMVDGVLWLLDHGGELGLQLNDVGHEWLRRELGQGLGWAEFALIASLAGDLMAHFGVEQAPEAGRATRSLAATGAAVWLLFLLEQTIWDWPLRARGFVRLESLLLFLGTTLIWAITVIQVTALSIAATRQGSRVLAEMDREDQEHDLLKPPSDSDFDLLATRQDGFDHAWPSSKPSGRWGDDF